ncbi:MAG: hypothetical protein P4L10_17525 [Acidobacteriaceae bacterium]|nr:hypothetical protein [Acidobacteriaceae bacterium]
MDIVIADYGLADSDVLFVEVCHNDEWVFELDPRLPKYFGPRNGAERITEAASYHRYWEVLNQRPFATVESRTFPLPEYARILQCMQDRENAIKAKVECEAMKTEEKTPVPSVPTAATATETNEPNGTSEANATNETSDGMDPNKDLVESPKVPPTVPISVSPPEIKAAEASTSDNCESAIHLALPDPEPVPEPLQTPEAVAECLNISIDLRSSVEPESMPEASPSPLVTPTHLFSPSAVNVRICV